MQGINRQRFPRALHSEKLVPTVLRGNAVFDAPRRPLGRGAWERVETSLGRLGLVLAIGISLNAWGANRVHASNEQPAARKDIHSYAEPDKVVVKHVKLRLDVDFRAKVIQGLAVLTIERKAEGPLILDTRDLKIERVWAVMDGDALQEANFRLKPADPILGSALEIQLPAAAKQVQIQYSTSPKASALQWLDAPRTAGKRHPFLFSQSEAIHARSWIPLQDSPGIRVTYSAVVNVPEGLIPVMSADRQSTSRSNGQSYHEFKMSEAIPPYLIALAVGDLKFQAIGPRTGVWAEPSVLEKAAWEFADTEKMVDAAEKRFGPYRWRRYDILVLPASFPFGGMENPKLTFATPTVIAGDRSLVSLIAHELAHSWSGNLVTNATWRDFWLNEGFTTYIERRIVEDLYGPGVAAVESVLGFEDLKEELGSSKPGDQVLHIDLAGRDPDDGMTRIPYEKGALFLVTLEKAFGRKAFDAWLKGYFDRHAFQSITTEDFLDDLRANLFPSDPQEAAKLDLVGWTEAPGLKAPYRTPVSTKLIAVDAQANAFTKGLAAKSIEAQSWTTREWLRFLHALPEKLKAAQLADLDATFGLTKRGNAEIACQWLLIAVRNGYEPANARLEEFLTTIGRRKFLMPLYKELVKTDKGKLRAKEIYAKARPFYHPISVDSVDKVVGKP